MFEFCSTIWHLQFTIRKWFHTHAASGGFPIQCHERLECAFCSNSFRDTIAAYVINFMTVRYYLRKLVSVWTSELQDFKPFFRLFNRTLTIHLVFSWYFFEMSSRFRISDSISWNRIKSLMICTVTTVTFASLVVYGAMRPSLWNDLSCSLCVKMKMWPLWNSFGFFSRLTCFHSS